MIRAASVYPAGKNVFTAVMVGTDGRAVGEEPVYAVAEPAKIIRIPDLCKSKQNPVRTFRISGIVPYADSRFFHLLYAVKDVCLLDHNPIIEYPLIIYKRSSHDYCILVFDCGKKYNYIWEEFPLMLEPQTTVS